MDGEEKNEIIGSFNIKMDKIIKLGERKGGSYFWNEIFGAPKDLAELNATTRKMNKHPKVASSLVGNVLMHVECSE